MSATAAPRLPDLWRCFQGVVPSLVATSDPRGVPNITYVSQVHLVNDGHIALSCQFFNKTRRNLDENPLAATEVYDPVTFEAYRLRLRFLRSEKSGPLFDTMALRIKAIASHTGMAGVFRLIAADVFEVTAIEKIEGFLVERPEAGADEGASVAGFRTELRGLQCVSEQINRSEDLETLLAGVLEALDVYFGFRHTMILLHDESCGRLVTISSRGYGDSGVGAEVAVGEGLIGTVARERRVLRMSDLSAELRYGRAVRREVIRQRSAGAVTPEIPLPGLPDSQSALVLPLCVADRLVGVLAAESRESVAFDEWDEAYLGVVGNQIALGIDRMTEIAGGEEGEERAAPAAESAAPPAEPVVTPAREKHTFVNYRSDDCIFVDNEYLIRNVPGRILWSLLGSWRRDGRTEFTNRELRLDPSLGLPEVKDNLESRLILLRHRLQEKCPDVRIERTGRGRFALVINAELELVER